MTQTERHLIAAYQRSGLSFQGISYARAVQIRPIRIALELSAKDYARAKPAPIQPALI